MATLDRDVQYPVSGRETSSAATPALRKDRTGLVLAVLIAWSIGAAVGYALFPSTDTNAVIAEGIWIAGVVVWLLASSRFYIGSAKGIAGQPVSQTGNFSREAE